MKRFVLMLVVCMLFTLPLMAQSQTQPSGQTGGVWDVISDPNNIAPAAFLLSNVADAKTDWHFTVAGKDYTITPAERLGIAGGSIFVAFTIRHYFPNTAKPINIVLAIATAYFAGRAYANTFNHGEPATPASVLKGQGLAFSYQFPIKR